MHAQNSGLCVWLVHDVEHQYRRSTTISHCGEYDVRALWMRCRALANVILFSSARRTRHFYDIYLLICGGERAHCCSCAALLLFKRVIFHFCAPHAPPPAKGDKWFVDVDTAKSDTAEGG